MMFLSVFINLFVNNYKTANKASVTKHD